MSSRVGATAERASESGPGAGADAHAGAGTSGAGSVSAADPRELGLRDRRRTAWLAATRPYPVARTAIELIFAAAFAVGVYELVVAGGTTLWPTATDDWILPMWIAAATIAGFGLSPVRSLARRLTARLWPSGAADPYAALASFVAGAATAEPAEQSMQRLAQLAVDGTGARSAEVWLTQPDGTLRLTAIWSPAASEAAISPPAPSLDELAAAAGSSGAHCVPLSHSGEQLGRLALAAPAHRDLTPRDLRLAQDIANAAGLLLQQAELTARLAAAVRRQTEQAAELDASRRRVLTARDAARDQLSGRINARVGEPLLQCSTMTSALLDEDAPPRGESVPQTLAEMTALIDTAIGDFRKIVHGVFPAVLTDHGLAAALENLLVDLSRRTVFSAQGVPRAAARVEAGVYFCVAALLGALPDGPEDKAIEMRLEATDEVLSATILDTAQRVDGNDGPPPDAAPEADAGATADAVQSLLRDRVEALEGRLRITQSPDGLRYELTVPILVTESVVT